MLETIKDYVKIPGSAKVQEYVKIPEYEKLLGYIKALEYAKVQEYLNAKTLNNMITLERCPISNKPEVCAANVWKLRSWFAAGAIGSGVLGAKAVPLVGFSVKGVVPNSVAAVWQSTIGNVAAGSLFSILQSLGATGIGVLLTGSISAVLALLGGLVTEKRLDWCTCQYDKEIFKSKL